MEITVSTVVAFFVAAIIAIIYISFFKKED